MLKIVKYVIILTFIVFPLTPSNNSTVSGWFQNGRTIRHADWQQVIVKFHSFLQLKQKCSLVFFCGRMNEVGIRSRDQLRTDYKKPLEKCWSAQKSDSEILMGHFQLLCEQSALLLRNINAAQHINTSKRWVLVIIKKLVIHN